MNEVTETSPEFDKQELLTEWVERLESGTIEQGRGVLEDPEGRQCCLGVLCDILVERGLANKYHDGENNKERTLFEYRGVYSSHVLPYPLAFEVFGQTDNGKPNTSGAFKSSTGYHELTSINDNGASFQDIAKIVRKEFM